MDDYNEVISGLQEIPVKKEIYERGFFIRKNENMVAYLHRNIVITSLAGVLRLCAGFVCHTSWDNNLHGLHFRKAYQMEQKDGGRTCKRTTRKSTR